MNTLYSLPPETLTYLFVAVIFVAFIFFMKKDNEASLTYGPTILTTAGIFATFLGIGIGLIDFDPADIQAGVPKLLSGLRTAIWGSVCGVLTAGVLKIKDYIRTSQSENNDYNEQPNNHNKIDELSLLNALGEIQKALVGNDESTLISQLKLSRQDSNDRLDALKKAQIEALDKLSQMSSATLIEALREVIKDFNSRITEQFGDNFKELNKAVTKLVEWQNTYSTQINEVNQRFYVISERLDRLMEQMDSSTTHYSLLVNDAARFTAISIDLASTIESLETQKLQLNSMIEAFSSNIIVTNQKIGDIEGNINSIATTIKSSTEETNKAIAAALKEHIETIKTSVNSSAVNIETINKSLASHAESVINNTNKQVSALDAALTEELNKSLTTLGRQLAALSEKFVSDYTPLTDKLKQLVETSRRL